MPAPLMRLLVCIRHGNCAVAMVKQFRDQPQEHLVRELRCNVQVKLPIGGREGLLVCRPTFHCKENLFECGNVLRLHVLGGFCRNLSLNEASRPQNFQWSFVTRTVRLFGVVTTIPEAGRTST